MKDYANDDVEENLKWVMLSACDQLSDKKPQGVSKSSLERWISVLINNKKMKDVIGYHGTAPSANSDRSDEDVANEFFKLSDPNNSNSTIYTAWMKANAYKSGFLDKNDDTRKCALLVKDDSDKQSLYDSLFSAEYDDYSFNKIYLYTASLVNIDNVEYTHETVYSTLNPRTVLSNVHEYAESVGVSLSEDETPVMTEITRQVIDSDGKYLNTELVEYTIMCNVTNDPLSIYSMYPENIENTTILFSFKPSTGEVSII